MVRLAHLVQNGVHLIPATERSTPTMSARARAHRVSCYRPDDAPLADFAAMMAGAPPDRYAAAAKELERLRPQFRAPSSAGTRQGQGTLFKAQVMRVL